MNKRVECGEADAIEIDGPELRPQFVARELREPVDFSRSRVQHGKMRVWLTACTIAAALAVLLVVSVSVLRG